MGKKQVIKIWYLPAFNERNVVRRNNLSPITTELFSGAISLSPPHMFYLLLLISFRENGSAAATRDLGFNQELTQSWPCSLQPSFPVNDPQKTMGSEVGKTAIKIKHLMSLVVFSSSLSQYGYSYGFCNAPFLFSLFFLHRNSCTAAGDRGLWAASLNYRHKAVGFLAGKRKEQEPAVEGCSELQWAVTNSGSI